MRHVHLPRHAVLLFAFALALLCALPCEAEPRLLTESFAHITCDYRDLGRKKAEKLPVYAAPFEEAWRGANGKAAVYTGETFTVLGSTRDGDWLMIDYQLSKTEHRVGWIKAAYRASGEERIYTQFPLDGALLRLRTDAELTDDPYASQRVVRQVQAGETVIGLCAFDWQEEALQSYIYVETEIEGKPAWGFLEQQAVEAVPMMHVEGDTLVIHEGVSAIGIHSGYDDEDETGERAVQIPLQPGRICISGIDFLSEAELSNSVRRIHWPASMKELGEEAIWGAKLRELVLPEGMMSASSYGIDASSIQRVVMERGYVGGMPDFDHCVIGSFDVEEGNPRYKSIDGVLFSADGKTLIRYPSGKTDLHYDVPAGVEVIAASAFGDAMMSIPLQSVSLPIGLEQIGAYAFSGCGRLTSLTVPLTVKELAETAFYGCASLERLSLPPGLSAEKDRWTAYTDDGKFNGDNGASIAYAGAGVPYVPIFEAMLLPRAGEQAVYAYANASETQSAHSYEAGTRCYVHGTENGRASVRINEDYEWDPEAVWVDLDCLMPEPGETLFSLSRKDFLPGLYTSALGAAADPQKAAGYAADMDWKNHIVRFYLRTNDDEDDWVEVPITEVLLYRPYTGDPYRLGYLVPDGQDVLVELLDSAEGAHQLSVAIGEQAEVLQAEAGWLLVKTARGNGWVDEHYFKEVLREDE